MPLRISASSSSKAWFAMCSLASMHLANPCRSEPSHTSMSREKRPQATRPPNHVPKRTDSLASSGHRKDTFRPALTDAIANGSTDDLKEADLNMLKQAAPGALDRASQAALQQIEAHLPQDVRSEIALVLYDISKSGQALANRYIQGIKGDGI